MLRRQAALGLGEVQSPQSHAPQDTWLLELEEKQRQKSGKSLAESMSSAADMDTLSNRRRGSHSPRIQRANCQQDPDYLNLPPIQRAISHQGAQGICPNSKPDGQRRPSMSPRRPSSGGSGKPYPTTRYMLSPKGRNRSFTKDKSKFEVEGVRRP